MQTHSSFCSNRISINDTLSEPIRVSELHKDWFENLQATLFTLVKCQRLNPGKRLRINA
jgi:hypothetical protein